MTCNKSDVTRTHFWYRAMEFIHAFIGEVASGEQSLDVAAGKIFLSRTTCTVRVFSVSLLAHEQNQGWKGVVHGVTWGTQNSSKDEGILVNLLHISSQWGANILHTKCLVGSTTCKMLPCSENSGTFLTMS